MSLIRKIFSKPTNTASGNGQNGLHLGWIRKRHKDQSSFNMTSDATPQQRINNSRVFPNTSSVSWLSNQTKKSRSKEPSLVSRRASFESGNELDSLERKMKARHPVLVVGTDPKKNWKLLNEIGEGAFGKVHKARHRFTDQLSAIKLFNKCDEEELEDCLMEVEILKDCKHRNIVRLYDAFLNDKILWVYFYILLRFILHLFICIYIFTFKKGRFRVLFRWSG